LVKDSLNRDYPYQPKLTNVNGSIFFPATDDNGSEIWKSDGTTAGAVMVKDLSPGAHFECSYGFSCSQVPNSSYPRYLSNVNGTLFFSTAIDSFELWKSDGTATGTIQLASIPRPTAFASANGTLFFTTALGDVWKSDGTAAGTGMVAHFTSSHDLATVGNTVYFDGASSGSFGLWKIDAAGSAVLVKNVDASQLANVNGSLFFAGNDGVHGSELWKSDGTADGTVLVKDLRAGAANSYPGALSNVGGRLFFTATDGVQYGRLWASINNNEAPQFIKGPDQSVTYKAGPQSVNAWAKAISAGPSLDAGQVVNFTVTNDNNGLFDVQPAIDAAGRLTYTPNLGATGTANVTVTLHDDGGTANGGVDRSQPQLFQITIRPPGPQHNLAKPLDVTGDGKIVAGDALQVINYLNAFGPQPVNLNQPAASPYYDTSGDDYITAVDALQIINYINALGPESNSSQAALMLSPETVSSDLVALLAFDQADGTIVRRQRST
jgi:ELWxxDGT repeat protein